MRLIALFNLKPGISAETYEDWARSVDLPTVRGLKSIDGFGVYRTLAVMGSDAAPPYQYIEIIDINSEDQFQADVSSAAMGEIAAQFQQMADVTFLVMQSIEEKKA